MSALTAFEVQSYRNGNWKIETITDTKDLALHQAEQLIMSPTVTKVRVIEEAYDQASEEQKFRIVFLRDKKVANRPPGAPTESKPESAAATPPPEPAAAPAAERPVPKQRGTSAVALSFKFGAIICIGIAAIIALRLLGTSS